MTCHLDNKCTAIRKKIIPSINKYIQRSFRSSYFTIGSGRPGNIRTLTKTWLCSNSRFKHLLAIYSKKWHRLIKRK